jgi:ABC-type antimicrobial peptide transport system permease subunit
MFSYDINKDFAVSWRRLNLYSIPQLIECGILPNIAEKIVAEREKNGLYNSVIDVKNRTGIPINHYHHLI